MLSLACLLSVGCTGEETLLGSSGMGAEVGFSAPDFQLENLHGGVSMLPEYRGKVVLINFWATWCGPCKAEMPTMEALYQAYHGRGFEILALSIDSLGASAVRTYIEASGFTFPVLMDSELRVNDLYRVRVVPTSVVINRRGIVVYRLLGASDWNSPAHRRRIERLLDQTGESRSLVLTRPEHTMIMWGSHPS